MPSLLAINQNTIGMSAAVVAALFWAVATVLYRRVGTVMPPVRMNLIKGVVSIVLFVGVVAWMWRRGGDNPLALPTGLMLLLLLSGVVGLGVGDTFFFAALNRIGARRTLLLFMLAPVLTALLAYPTLSESLALHQWVGVIITCGGIGWVIAERPHAADDGHVDKPGIAFGIIAAVCQAIGSLMSRKVFDESEIAAAPSALLRMLGGCAVLMFMLPMDKRLPAPGGDAHLHPNRPKPVAAWTMLAFAMLFGTFFGIWLQQIALKDSAQVGVAQTLLGISPLFILPIAIILRERVSPRACLGAAVSVLGVALLFDAFNLSHLLG